MEDHDDLVPIFDQQSQIDPRFIPTKNIVFFYQLLILGFTSTILLQILSKNKMLGTKH